ncbi:phosphatase PAP2 family protein [Actinomadura chibensis]|uniref:Phosphatase PAP2 family protein n=1 Tax=Actinomadura chibensis TaxID=392828 RepID=A0A5D0NV09_9ACTN|nr:phosphatase PAP2 family protein [Actinomadura chibensis]TYB48039.1 phosphatase PAP2 family protein [Actinomadura chibensis]
MTSVHFVSIVSVLLFHRLGGTSAPGRLALARTQLAGTLGPVGAFVTLYGAGMFVLTAGGLALGELVQRVEGPVDRAVFDLMEAHYDRRWADPVELVGRLGNVWQTRFVALAAIVVLTGLALWRRERAWVPGFLVGTSVLVQKFDQAALAKVVDRGHPPTTLGTYPSGGCARVLVVYGTITFLALAYSRAGRAARMWSWSAIVTLAYVEGYTRTYLNKHWVTDVLGGWAVGGAMLLVTVFAARALLDARRTAPDGPPAPARPHPDRSPDPCHRAFAGMMPGS